MAGLCAARVLSDHVDRVILLDRDDLPEDVASRRGVPQGRHAHALLPAGQQAIESWFPGFTDDLVADGAESGPIAEAIWWQDGGYKLCGDFGERGITMSRPLLERAVRRRLEETTGVEIRRGVSVNSLLVEGETVTGVATDDGPIEADLVVDCSGRNSRLVGQVDHGELPMSKIHVGVSYGTRILRRRLDDLPMDAKVAVIAPTPPEEPRGAVLLAIEDDRWILTQAGMHGDTVPMDDDEYLAFARSLPSPVIADLLERAEPLSPVMSYRYPHSQRRHFEKADRYPRGYIGLGDIICSFNPIYGQGMSSAAMQAKALGEVLAERGLGAAGLARVFYKRAARVVDNPWQIAAGADFLHPETTGEKAPGTDLINRYVHHVQRATHVSWPVLERMIEVQSLLRPPSSLMSPLFMARVFAASKRAGEGATAEPRILVDH